METIIIAAVILALAAGAIWYMQRQNSRTGADSSDPTTGSRPDLRDQRDAALAQLTETLVQARNRAGDQPKPKTRKPRAAPKAATKKTPTKAAKPATKKPPTKAAKPATGAAKPRTKKSV